MSKMAIALLSILTVAVVGVFIVVGSIISFNNATISFDYTIKAQVNDMKANYNKYFNQVKEVAQVPTQQVAKLKEIYNLIVTGRKTEGEMVRLITEANLQIDQNTFLELQRLIVSGRNEIYMIQKIHIDTVREYNTFISVFPNSLINVIFFHRKEVTPTTPISEKVQEIFETGKDKPMEVF